MANNDFFMVSFKILTYLKFCYEHGQEPEPDMLKPVIYSISAQQFVQTMQMLLDDEFIKGMGITRTTSGPVMYGLNDAMITRKGLEYLAENTMMKKAYNVVKEIRDWIPFLGGK